MALRPVASRITLRTLWTVSRTSVNGPPAVASPSVPLSARLRPPLRTFLTIDGTVLTSVVRSSSRACAALVCANNGMPKK